MGIRREITTLPFGSRLHPVLLSLLLAVGTAAAADEAADADEPPVVGRPADVPFSEASGWFEVQARAEPTTLEAQTPLTFTLSVRAVRPPRRPPQRLDLQKLPEIAERFYVEDPSLDPIRPDDRTWEFVYRLKPRRTGVKEIPSLPFVYFNPYLLTATKGFQVIYSDPIPLRVLPRETVQVPLQASENAFVLATGPAVLERRSSWTPPSPGAIAALLLAPPCACLVWYLCWRRMYPDAARLASQRRSRAARQALNSLHAARRLNAEARAARIAEIVAAYLHQRLDLNVAEPTPREIGTLFAQRGCSPELTEQAIRFFRTCDTVRFLPAAGPVDLHDSAVQFVLAVEEATTRNRQDAKNAKEDNTRQFYSFSLSFLGVLGVLAVPSFSLSDREIQERAETAFQEGVRLREAAEQARPHFRDASASFEKLRQRGIRNELLYRNLGNAYLLADDVPNAILSYQRGLTLSPTDPALREGLVEARQRVTYPPSGDLGRPRTDDRPPWLPHLRSRWLMLAAIVCYVLGCVAVARWRMVRRERLLMAGLLALLLAGVLSGWLALRAEEQRERAAHPLVVIARDGVLLRRGNGMVFPPRYDTPLNRGVEGRLRFERGDWVQVELSGGEIGWVPRGAVLVDSP